MHVYKTEVLWSATTRRQHQLPRSPLLVDGTPINPVQSVRDLGIFKIRRWLID